MNEKHSSDFYKVPDIVFDIKKLRVELDRVLKHKKFKTLGITNFAAIPINKIDYIFRPTATKFLLLLLG